MELGSDTKTVSDDRANVSHAIARAAACGALNCDLLSALVAGVGGFLVGRALGSPWTVGIASALFGMTGMAASTAYVVSQQNRAR